MNQSTNGPQTQIVLKVDFESVLTKSTVVMSPWWKQELCKNMKLQLACVIDFQVLHYLFSFDKLAISAYFFVN